MHSIEQCEFSSPISKMHWAHSNGSSLIAIAISSSNVLFYDVR